MNKLIGMDFSTILDRDKIQSEICQEIANLMDEIRNSVAFKRGAKI